MTETTPDAPQDSAPEADVSPGTGWHRWFDNRFRTPVAVYGLIVYSALILVASDHGTAADLLVTSVSTLVVFYFAHVFAHTLSDHGKHPLGAATRHAFRDSLGMLYAALPTTVAMFIANATSGDVDDVADAGMWTSVAMLFVLGLSAYTRTGAPVWLRLLGAFGTAMLGLLVVLLEYVLH
jgi:hypothetical protein